MVGYLAKYLRSMKRIWLVMITFGLAMGLGFPYFTSPFVIWDPDRKLYFQLASLAAGFAVGTFCYFLVKTTLYQRNLLLARRKADLEQAKERFSSLTRAAILKQSWHVSLADRHVPTCWRLKNCENEKCPVFGEENMRCWLIVGTHCGGAIQGHFAQKMGDCSKCAVYQETVGQDPINEIGENFNSLMLSVCEKEEQLAAAHQELKSQYGELELLHQQAQQRADTDLLTGLHNHAHFQKHLKNEVSREGRQRRQLALIMLDLDYFKSVNDHFGHQQGDAVLKAVGALLLGQIRQEDYAARYGGEEFVIVMPGCGGQAACEAAERMRAKVGALASGTGLPARYLSASFGVADMPASAADADSLIAAADAALLFAKRKGRDRVAYFRDLSETELQDGDLDRLHDHLEGASLQTIRALAEAVDANDLYSDKDGAIIRNVAVKMSDRLGLDCGQAETLVLATRLHDIGKIGVPGSVLRKKEKLSPQELSLVRRHPQIGEQLLREAEQIQELVSAVLYHHERWDGKGYPEHLKGEEIPLMARVVGIMDAYRAMLSDRPYRRALTPQRANAELKKGAGAQFDPKLVDIFIEIAGGQDSELKRAV